MELPRQSDSEPDLAAIVAAMAGIDLKTLPLSQGGPCVQLFSRHRAGDGPPGTGEAWLAISASSFMAGERVLCTAEELDALAAMFTQFAAELRAEPMPREPWGPSS